MELYNPKSTKIIEGVDDTPDKLEIIVETKVKKTKGELIGEKEEYELQVEKRQEYLLQAQKGLEEINRLLAEFKE